jgi:hypothetical protein
MGSHSMGLPLVLWLKDVFEAIGNALGSYYEANYTFCDTRYYGMERILVGLETNKGLVEEMVIKHGKTLTNSL